MSKTGIKEKVMEIEYDNTVDEFIEEVSGGEEFWKSDTEDTLRDAYEHIHRKFTHNETQDIINMITSAIRSEYGD